MRRCACYLRKVRLEISGTDFPQRGKMVGNLILKSICCFRPNFSSNAQVALAGAEGQHLTLASSQQKENYLQKYLCEGCSHDRDESILCNTRKQILEMLGASSSVIFMQSRLCPTSDRDKLRDDRSLKKKTKLIMSTLFVF